MSFFNMSLVPSVEPSSTMMISLLSCGAFLTACTTASIVVTSLKHGMITERFILNVKTGSFLRNATCLKATDDTRSLRVSALSHQDAKEHVRVVVHKQDLFIQGPKSACLILIALRK